MSKDVLWKDKEYSPRFECTPYIWIHIYKLNIIWFWLLPKKFYFERLLTDDYWEQALWYLYYYNNYKMKVPDIVAAEKYWPWEDCKTYISTWNTKFLIDYATKK